MKKNLFVVGSDPEFMLTDAKGLLYSAIKRVPGTKAQPLKVEGGAIQRDNVLCEINTDPAESIEEFTDNLAVVLRRAAKIVHPLLLTPKAGADFPKRCLRAQAARVFGCDPDYNAWPDEFGMLSMNLIPAEAATLPFRSAGGHLHIGYNGFSKDMLENDFGKMAVIQLLDIFTALFGVIIDDDPSAAVRRTLYGKAGAHRPKEYGVEYRALSNFWLRSPELVELTCLLAEVAVEQALSDRTAEIVASCGGGKKIQTIINENRVEEARAIFAGPVRKFLPEKVDAVLNIEHPMKALAPFSFYQTWELHG